MAVVSQVQLLRSRHSVIGVGAIHSTPRAGHSKVGASGSAEHLNRLIAEHHGSSDSASLGPDAATAAGSGGPAGPAAGKLWTGAEGQHLQYFGIPDPTAELEFEAQQQQDRYDDGEREQRLLYLRQAFCGFFRAKQGVEMQNLARVMCAILGVDEQEQAAIMESIARLVPALVATTTLESLSYNFSSLFS